MEKIDCAIIGAGVIGLSVAYELSKLSSKEIVVFEKHRSFGQETSSRNSEVIHAGIYYPKGSLKSTLCIKGNKMLYEFCEKFSVKHKKCGKIIVATDENELNKINQIFAHAIDCGAVGLSKINGNRIKEIEPDVFALGGIFSSETGIIDVHGLMQKLFELSQNNGVIFSFENEVLDIKKRNDGYIIKTSNDDVFAKTVINCAGLNSDKIAQMVGIDILKYGYKIYLCKGDYFSISCEKNKLSHLIYPVPHEKGYGLGVHATIDLSGRIRLGPDANYVEEINYDVNPSKAKDFYLAAKKYLPWLKMEMIMPDTSGIRPKIQGPNDEVKDFIIKEESDKGFPNFINLIGIESPGLTSCLAIGEYVAKMIVC